MACDCCQINKATLIRPKNKQKLCKSCFIFILEEEIHQTIIKNKIFSKGEKIAVAISGGKDSTVLAHILNVLNKRHEYGIGLFLLSIDEGIKNYRDHSLATVEQNKIDYNLPLKIISYQESFDTTMDEIVSKIGLKRNCTYCGILRRHALEKGAQELDVNQIVTGHNADDMAETVLMNFLRGDIQRLKTCTAIKSFSQHFNIPRSKPFKYVFEKEIVMYAFYNNLKYFSTECTYSPGAYRGHARLFIKELERTDPNIILKIINSGEYFHTQDENISVYPCILCGHATGKENGTCKSCELLDSLEKITISG